MNVKIIALVALVLAIIAVSGVLGMVSSVDEYGYVTLGKGGKPGKPGPKTECGDGIDNDGDGKTDYKWHKKFQENIGDLGCTSKDDNDETNCGDGVCEGGEVCSSCVADCGTCPITTTTPPTTTTTTIPRSCDDTDGGLDYLVKGTVSGYSNGSPYSYTDVCLADSDLKEYWCVNNQALTEIVSCLNVSATTCSNGACV